jgi:hypothetical protein
VGSFRTNSDRVGLDIAGLAFEESFSTIEEKSYLYDTKTH